MAANKRERWVRQVAEFERSGLTRRAWCAAHGVNLSTLDYWRCRVRDVALAPTSGSGRKRGAGATGTSKALALVPLRIVTRREPGAAMTGDVRCDEVVLTVGDGLRLVLPPGTAAPWLALLLRELR